MDTLYHYPLCPFSRQIRILLKEFEKEVQFIKEEYWLRSKHLLRLNPAGEVPVIVTETNVVLCDIYSLLEYFQEIYRTYLMPQDLITKANVRRIISWFNHKFRHEVTKHILNEKLIRLSLRAGAPNTVVLRRARQNLVGHLNYCANILSSTRNLAYDSLSIADIVAASHLSVVDYFGEINWQQYRSLKEWYMVIKSRPSFRPILQDYVIGVIPAAHYAKLDF